MNARARVPILITLFLDALGMGIVAPIVPNLLTNRASPHYILSPATSNDTALFLFGVLLTAYPVMMFFATPILGQMSDRYGRRPVLLLSIAGTVVGWALTAIGIGMHNFPLMLAGRAIDGLTAGNGSVADAAVADITTPDQRTTIFAQCTAAFMLGMASGPALGGVLSDSSISSWFGTTTPFWVGCGLSALDLVILLRFLPETNKNRSDKPIAIVRNLVAISKVFKWPQLRSVFLTLTFSGLGGGFHLALLPYFLIHRFGLDEAGVAHYLTYLAACMVFTQLVTTRVLAKRFKERVVTRVTLLGSALTYAGYVLAPRHEWIYVIGFFAVSFGALSTANLWGLISRRAPPDQQGEVFGVATSLSAVAGTVPPLLGTTLAALGGSGFTMIAASFSMLLAWISVILFIRPIRVSDGA